MLYVLIVFLPLAAALLAGLFGRQLQDRGAMVLTCGAVSASAVLSLVAFWLVVTNGPPPPIPLFRFIESGGLSAAWALRVDELTAVMLIVVTGVSALVHIYSVGYMQADPCKPRFFAYLSLFTFFMLALVTSDNFVQLYFGWEGVGLCSYLLIGFWYERASANAAAIKAFIVNRVGDFGFTLGIAGIFFAFGTLDFATVFERAPELADETFSFLGFDVHLLTTLTFLLFLGAMGKSAQLGLHTWLPDAMEGPTPVSALIHAATMVTAGVFMVARLSPLFEWAPATLAFVAVIGALTAFVTASIALVQNDIKRVIAYSTCSQLGYMFFAAGVSAYPAAIFHLFTHGFFKALLFLGAGSVIHALADEQDMRRMGGLKRGLPVTCALMWIAALASAGIPVFSGYFSKDMILEAAFAARTEVGQFAFVLGLMTAAMTAFYTWRLLFLVFHGEARADAKTMAHVHESPRVMLWPLYVLAFGSAFAGLAFAPLLVGESWPEFWGESIVVRPEHTALLDAHLVPLWVRLAPIGAAAVGIALAWQLYIRRRDLPDALMRRNWPLYRLLLDKWYFDELYDLLFVRPARWLGRLLWLGGDGRIIDGFGPDRLAAAVVDLARRASSLQTGYIYHYAFVMLIGLALLVTFYFYLLGR
jgi:NADH-quinone oxidoreductase subunit L